MIPIMVVGILFRAPAILYVVGEVTLITQNEAKLKQQADIPLYIKIG